MEVWVLEWSYPYDSETNITIWANQKDAQKQALEEINELITNGWDLEDDDAAACADDIQDMMKRGLLEECLDRFHDYQDNYNSDQAQYWRVYMREVLSADQSEVPTIPPPTAYKATSPGATCRGNHQEFNPYAYADRSDGTYLCRQCQTFQHIFGVKQS